MKPGTALDNLVAAIAKSCRSGLEPAALRSAVLPGRRRAVPIDALWWATVDPATLLFTQAYREEIPGEAGPNFVENEFLCDDVNKWVELARDRLAAYHPAHRARPPEVHLRQDRGPQPPGAGRDCAPPALPATRPVGA